MLWAPLYCGKAIVVSRVLCKTEFLWQLLGYLRQTKSAYIFCIKKIPETEIASSQLQKFLTTCCFHQSWTVNIRIYKKILTT